MRVPHDAVVLNIERILSSVSEPGIGENERHRAVAVEQLAAATEMRARAQQMSDQALEMRKLPRRRIMIRF